MILTIAAVSLKRLLHNRIELLLAFAVPIAFFSIFALIFGSVGSGTTATIKVAAVDTVESDRSRQAMRCLEQAAGMSFVELPAAAESPAAVTAAAKAAELIRHGKVSVAIVLRPTPAGGIRAELLSDVSDQIAPQLVAAMVRQALVPHAQPTPESRTARTVALEGSGQPDASVEIVDILGGGKSNPVISMYAAGIAVMFLLFGAAGGGGMLLEERENMTLDRLLTSGLTMDDLLLGKWLYMTLLGVAQTTLMFAWGQAVFGIDWLSHFDGFFAMTLVTAGAAAAFGLLLASLCRTRGQLNGLSVVVILAMSALGGSMVPRYVMSPGLREAGLWTFNAWALDGYDKVFWRELPVADLWPQLAVLMAAGTAFLLTARLLAVRWETD